MRRAITAALAALVWTVSPLAAQERQPLRIIGFSDFNYFATDDRGAARGFRAGALTGHLTGGLAERASFFTEVTAFATSNFFLIEVQRVALRYDFRDAFRLSAGRFHTPIGYWNTYYHHGQWLQLSAARPQMLSFGSGFLPQHYVGVLAEGRIAPASAGLEYAAGLGNGRDRNLARAGDAGDSNGNRAAVISVSLAPQRLSGWRAGGGAYWDRAASAQSVPEEFRSSVVDERILFGYVTRERGRTSVHAEYARIEHEARAPGAPSFVSDAYFVQAGYRLGGVLQALTPYARYERIEVAEGDPLYEGSHRDAEIALLGIRYDFIPLAALKAEYRSNREDGSVRTNTLALQLSVSFGVREEPVHEPVAGSVARPDTVHGH